MLKKYLLALCCLAILLAACGGAVQTPAPNPVSTDPVAVPPVEPNSATREISFMIFGDDAEKEAYDSLVAAFKEQHPEINVNMIYLADQADYRSRLGADFAAGTPADIVLINYRRHAGLSAKGALEPLGPYLAKSTIIQESDFYTETMKPFYWNDTLMCIPQNLSSLVVYYNKTMFEKEGVPFPSNDWTWDDFLATAQALSKDLDGDGMFDQHGLGTEASIFRVTPFIWQNGGDLVDNPSAPTKLAIDSPETKAALEWFIDLQVKHHVVPDPIQENAEQSESRFLNGRMGMFLNSRRGVPTYRQIKDFDWDVAPLPRGKQTAGILHADAFCMASLTNDKDAAWTFIEFANSPAGQTILAKSGRTVPSLKAVAESPAFLDPNAKPANSQVFLDVIPHIRAVPVMESWIDIERILSQEFELAFHGDESLDTAITNAMTLAKEYFPQ